MTSIPINLGGPTEVRRQSFSTSDVRKLQQQLDIPKEERKILQFVCSLEREKGASFAGFGLLFDNYLCFQSSSKARIVTVSGLGMLEYGWLMFVE